MIGIASERQRLWLPCSPERRSASALMEEIEESNNGEREEVANGDAPWQTVA